MSLATAQLSGLFTLYDRRTVDIEGVLLSLSAIVGGLLQHMPLFQGNWCVC